MIHLEVQCKTFALQHRDDIAKYIRQLYVEKKLLLNPNSNNINYSFDKYLSDKIESITISDCKEIDVLNLDSNDVRIDVFAMNREEQEESYDDEHQSHPLFTQCILPHNTYSGLWESIIFDDNIKEKLLGYMEIISTFLRSNVDFHIISYNRILLLNGPPGTGKTSLCKALAQKFSIRYQSRYSEFFLIEINSHSLFSKWFSESGKLVGNIFQQIKEIADDPSVFVIILIDEIESLTTSRLSMLSGAEPSDSLRVVNAMLTQLDSLKTLHNIIVLATSNMIEAIDTALIDRVDIQQYINFPSNNARQIILKSCIKELIDKGIVSDNDYINERNEIFNEIIDKTDGYSGRALRKLPIKIHSMYIEESMPISLRNYLKAMCAAGIKLNINRENGHRKMFNMFRKAITV